MVAETFRDVCPAGQDLVYALGLLEIAEDDHKPRPKRSEQAPLFDAPKVRRPKCA